MANCIPEGGREDDEMDVGVASTIDPIAWHPCTFRELVYAANYDAL